jgi:predicted  nucleic acid-binding Zn-ribbon protein
MTLANVITISVLLGGVILTAGSLQSDIRALAQRVEKGETRDDKTADALVKIEGSVIRIETEQKAVRADAERLSRQLDRLENLIRNNTARPPQ